MKDIDADYYGYRDDDDGILLPLEDKAEKTAIAKAIAEWKAKQDKPDTAEDEDEEDIYPVDKDVRNCWEKILFLDIKYNIIFQADTLKPNTEADPMGFLGPRFTAHVPLPTQKDIEFALLQKRKKELMEKYGISDMDI